jgi:Mce-associated membrane protein
VSAPQTPGRPPKRRRIAGEVKPGEAPVAPQPKLHKPKLPKRPNPPRDERAGGTPTQPVVATTSDLPAAPPRSDALRVRRPKPSATVMSLLVLAIGSVGFGAFGVWRGVDEWRSNSIVEARASATDAASSASEKMFSYKYNKLDEHMREAQATMTPEFAKKFRSISPALKALAPQRKIQVKAVVRYAAAKECGDACSPRKATVLIFIDQARISADTKKPTVFGNRIEVSMVERNGKWLVNNVKAL